MRSLTKAIALVFSLVPSCGYSLGIGDIKLHSALNQNLDAEISLVVSPGDKISDINVNLAPPDKFDEAGVPWTSFLSKIKFEAISGANGAVKIKISSREAVKEPILDFLLQVNWPKGSLYREFTVLVDPPTAYNKATNPTIGNPENYIPIQAVIPQNEPVKIQRTSVEKTIGGAGQYGPTNRNDTLWKVSEQPSRQMGVSVEQMMMAVYEENPHAFYKENVNGLLTGKILKIPEKDIVVKLSRKQALAEFNRQTQAWKNSSVQVSVEPGSAKKETLDNKLTLAAPKELDIAKNVINAPENEQLAAKNKVDKVESKSFDKEIVSPVNDALQDKVSELEKQLAMMQKIIALKDQQLAVLQNQISPKPAIQTMTGQAEVVNPAPKKQAGQLNSKSAIQAESKAKVSSKINYLWLGSGILPLLGWLWWRKRKSVKQTDSHNLFASSSVNEPFEFNRLFSTSTEINSAKKAHSDIERPIFSEITFSDFQASDTEQDEIDPVSEADVYLAYGRYQQAEDLLRAAIKDQPNRDECKLKLLKIFHTNKDNQAFQTYANELAKAGKNDDLEFWGKVTEMGREICKDSLMFSSEEDGFSPEENTILEKLPVKSNEFEDTKNESIDFVSSTIETKCDGSSETQDRFVIETPDFKLNNEFESFDFEFGLSETDIKAIDNIDASAIKKPIENDQLMDSLTNKSPSSNNKFGSDFLNRDFYFDKPVSEVNRDVFDLTDMDEFETKLDLAKAYIDMSDTDTAKEIICEVLEKGTADQKKIAQLLLKDLK